MSNKRVIAVVLIVATLLVGGVAVYLGIRLRQQPTVAPQGSLAEGATCTSGSECGGCEYPKVGLCNYVDYSNNTCKAAGQGTCECKASPQCDSGDTLCQTCNEPYCRNTSQIPTCEPADCSGNEVNCGVSGNHGSGEGCVRSSAYCDTACSVDYQGHPACDNPTRIYRYCKEVIETPTPPPTTPPVTTPPVTTPPVTTPPPSVTPPTYQCLEKRAYMDETDNTTGNYHYRRRIYDGWQVGVDQVIVFFIDIGINIQPVTFTDVLPSSLTFVDADNNCNYDTTTRTVTCTDTTGRGFRVRVNDVTGELQNTAVVQGANENSSCSVKLLVEASFTPTPLPNTALISDTVDLAILGMVLILSGVAIVSVGFDKQLGLFIWGAGKNVGKIMSGEELDSVRKHKNKKFEEKLRDKFSK